MNRIFLTILLTLISLVMLVPASADVPKKQALGRYSRLWSKSPFTVPPAKEDQGPVVSALEDYVLTGVSKLPDGYFVVLMDKKKRERVAIIPGEQNSKGFEVVSVIQDPIDYKATQVRIKVRNETGLVGYDEKFLALKKPVASGKKPPTKPGTRPAIPGQKPSIRPTGSTKKPAGTPRVRRVPTPPKR